MKGVVNISATAFQRMRRKKAKRKIEHEENKNISFENKTVQELKDICKQRDIKGFSNMNKEELIKHLNEV